MNSAKPSQSDPLPECVRAANCRISAAPLRSLFARTILFYLSARSRNSLEELLGPTRMRVRISSSDRICADPPRENYAHIRHNDTSACCLRSESPCPKCCASESWFFRNRKRGKTLRPGPLLGRPWDHYTAICFGPWQEIQHDKGMSPPTGTPSMIRRSLFNQRQLVRVFCNLYPVCMPRSPRQTPATPDR